MRWFPPPPPGSLALYSGLGPRDDSAFFFFKSAQAGPHCSRGGEVVGPSDAAWPARDPPRPTSPAHPHSPYDAPHGCPPLAELPQHPHHDVDLALTSIGAAADGTEPPHTLPVDLHNVCAASVDDWGVEAFTGVDDLPAMEFDDDQPLRHPSHRGVRVTAHGSDALGTDHTDDTLDVEGLFEFEYPFQGMDSYFLALKFGDLDGF